MRAHIAANIDLNHVECGQDTYGSKFRSKHRHIVSANIDIIKLNVGQTRIAANTVINIVIQ